jgi:hypothetical protein
LLKLGASYCATSNFLAGMVRVWRALEIIHDLLLLVSHSAKYYQRPPNQPPRSPNWTMVELLHAVVV